MNTKNEKPEMEFSNDMKAGFYVEELENRLEMAAIGNPGGPLAPPQPTPNLACWEIDF